MPGPRDDVNFNKIIELHLAGESVQKLSADFGVSRPTIARRLRRAEVPVRGRSEAALMRHSKLGPNERLQLLESAHQATRGRVKTQEEQVKRARSREASPPPMSAHEAQFAMWLSERDISYRREVAIDKYNIDFALPGNVAVEILGGEWHGTRKKALRHSERTPHILDAGWTILFIWATPTWPLEPAVAEHAIALSKAVSTDPALLGEYRVIRGDAKLLARARAKDYHRAGIPTARKRPNVTRSDFRPL